jgi:DNA transformation protein
MTGGSGFVDNVLDLLDGWGGVSARRMFGGHGLYRQGVMFALVAEDILYLKADDQNRAGFEAAGMGPFTYEAKSRKVALSYYEAPPELFDDGEAMIVWAKRAFAAALRAQNQSKPLKRPRKPGARTITKS